MDRNKKLEELKNLKQKYVDLREYVLFYKNMFEYNQEEKNKEKKDIKVKSLVLTKPFYGKNLVVG